VGNRHAAREFLHVDDLATAACFLMECYDGAEPLNVGTGEDLTIAELAAMVARVVGFQGRIAYDSSKPDGPPRKLLDVSRIHALGWKARIPLDEGIAYTYDWYRARPPRHKRKHSRARLWHDKTSCLTPHAANAF